MNPFETLTQTLTAATTINHQVELLKDELATLTSTVDRMGKHATDLRIRVADAEALGIMEAVIISGPLKGKFVSIKMTTEGKFVTRFTLEEMEILRAYEASKKVDDAADSESKEDETPSDLTDVTPDQLPPTQPTDN